MFWSDQLQNGAIRAIRGIAESMADRPYFGRLDFVKKKGFDKARVDAYNAGRSPLGKRLFRGLDPAVIFLLFDIVERKGDTGGGLRRNSRPARFVFPIRKPKCAGQINLRV